MCWQDITGPHTQAHFFHHFLSSESFSPPSCPPWQLSFCMSWRLSLPSSLAKGIWIQHRASWPPTSPSHLPSVAFCSGRAWRPWYHGHLHHTFHPSPPFCRSFISIFHRRILQLLISHILQLLHLWAPAREAFLSALPQINWLMVKLVADNFKYFSPVSSCQIKKSQQVRFKPCFSKRQCSFGQQPCPQPPASPESDTPFLCQKKCYRAVWFPPGDLPPSWVSRAEKAVHVMHNATAFPNTLHFRNKSISLSPGMQKLSAHKANSPECSKKAQKGSVWKQEITSRHG